MTKHGLHGRFIMSQQPIYCLETDIRNALKILLRDAS